MPPALMSHVEDPANEIRKRIGDISQIEVLHNQILVGVYIRPEKTKGGILLTSQTRDEDRYQGKAGLVLKKGPLAFVDDDNNKFHGQNVDIGDWVFYRVSDGFPLVLNGTLCRLLEEVHVKGKIPSPDVVF
jgi:co-chaperonin GroES (HSP10)